MKVKVMEIESDFSTYGRPQKIAKIESALREWLDDNPNASIEHVAQMPVASHSNAPGLTTSVLVTIFYRD
jgi:hypothetical protein